MTERLCPACGVAAAGRFCSECGASLAEAPVELGQALRAEAVEVIGFDRRLIATLRDLLLHPARIVRASVAGDRAAYLPPLRLFFALAGTYMLGLSLVQPYDFDAAAMQRAGVGREAAARIQERIRDKGLTTEQFNERFESRMNTVGPVATALALLPMVALLKLFDRRRSWANHLMFILAASNGVWLVSLLLLPLAYVSAALYIVVISVTLYVYLALPFFALYRGRTTVRTIGRFAVFVAVDLALSLLLSTVLFLVVYRSVLIV